MVQKVREPGRSASKALARSRVLSVVFVLSLVLAVVPAVAPGAHAQAGTNPRVELTAPAHGATFTSASSVNIEWTYYDYNPSVARDCTVTVTDLTTGDELFSTTSDCSGFADTENGVSDSATWTIPAGTESNNVEIAVTLDDESDAIQVVVDVEAPRITQVNVTRDGGKAAIGDDDATPVDSPSFIWTNAQNPFLEVHLADKHLDPSGQNTLPRVYHKRIDGEGSDDPRQENTFVGLQTDDTDPTDAAYTLDLSTLYTNGDKFGLVIRANDTYRMAEWPAAGSIIAVGIDTVDPTFREFTLQASNTLDGDTLTDENGNTWVRGNVTLLVDAADNSGASGIEKVTFYRDTTSSLGHATTRAQISGMYELTVDTGALGWSDAGNVLDATVADRATNDVSTDDNAAPDNLVVYADNAAPSITRVSPTQDPVATAQPNVTYRLTDDSGVGIRDSDVQLYMTDLDGNEAAVGKTYRENGFLYVTYQPESDLDSGTYGFRLSYSDRIGNTDQDAFSLTVDLEAPTFLAGFQGDPANGSAILGTDDSYLVTWNGAATADPRGVDNKITIELFRRNSTGGYVLLKNLTPAGGLELYANQTAWDVSAGDVNGDLMDLDDARLQFKIWDADGNPATYETGEFTIDSTPPDATPNIDPYILAPASINGTASDPLDVASGVDQVWFRITDSDTATWNNSGEEYTAGNNWNAADKYNGLYVLNLSDASKVWTDAEAYTIDMKVRDRAGNVAITSGVSTTVDTTAPVINDIGFDGSTTHHDAAFTLALDTSDASGIASATVHLVDGNGNLVSKVGSTDAWEFEVPGFMLTQPEITVPVGSSQGLGYPPLGSYRVRVTVVDEVDLSTEATTGNNQKLTIEPRVEWTTLPRSDLQTLTLAVGAGFRAVSTPANASCDGTTKACTLSKLVVRGKTGDGWMTLATRFAPDTTKPNVHGLYSYDFDIPLNDATRDVTEVEVIGSVSYGEAPHLNHKTTLKKIVERPAGGLMQVLTPWMDDVNATGYVEFDVRLAEVPGVLGDEALTHARMTLHLRDAETGLNVSHDPDKDPHEQGLLDLAKAENDDVTAWELNITEKLGERLGEGAYTADVTLWNKSRSDDLLTQRVNFSVERDFPAVTLNTGAFVHAGNGDDWVGPEVPLEFTVDAGYANVTGIDDVKVRLLKGNGGWVTSPTVDWWMVNGSAVPPKAGYDGSVTIRGNLTIPSTVSHGATFFIYVNATSNLNGTAGGATPRGYDSVLVKLDRQAPDVAPRVDPDLGVGDGFLHSYNATIKDAAEPRLEFNATDSGAGVGEAAGAVQVILFKVGEDDGLRPWNNATGAWAAPGTDVEPLNASFVELVDGVGTWKLNDTRASSVFTRMAGAGDTNLTDEFFVKVTFQDLAGNAGETDLIPVSADLGTPYINDTSLRKLFQDKNQHWGGDRNYIMPDFEGRVKFSVDVTEDNWDHWAGKPKKLKSAAKLLIVNPYDEEVVVNATHVNATDDVENGATKWNVTWILEKRDIDWVGNYSVGVWAQDPVGQKNWTHNATTGTVYLRNFTVNDTIDPVAVDFGFVPAIPGPDSPVTPWIQAFDDQEVVEVNVTLYSWDDDGNKTVEGPHDLVRVVEEDHGRLVRWELADSLDLGLEEGDTWLADFNLTDAAGNVTKVPKVGFVTSDNAAPVISLESPGTGVTWLNESSTVRVKVVDPNLDTNAFTVRTGSATDSLSEASVDLESPDGRTYYLNLSPEGLASGDHWVLNVSATDLRGATTHGQWEFDVDGETPTGEFVVDVTAPGADGVPWVSGESLLTIAGADNHSGVDEVRYAVDGGAEQTYDAPFSLTGDEGVRSITWTVVDVAGNTATGAASVRLDASGPDVSVGQPGRTVRATVTDGDGVGLNASTVTLLYTLGGSSSFSPVPMNNTVGNVWEASIPDSVVGDVAFYLRAEDLLGNEGTYRSADDPYSLATTNVAPLLTITRPTGDAEVRGELDVRWQASDPDNDPVTLSVSVEDVNGDVHDLVSNLTNDGREQVDVSALPDGTATVTVRASDGEIDTTKTVSVLLVNTAPVQVTKAPTSAVKSGSKASFTITVNHPFKQVDKVMATITVDGAVVDQVEMTETEANTYAVDYTPQKVGEHKVRATVTYTDGSTEDADVGVFSVDAASPAAVGARLIALVAMGAVAIAMAAYAAFGRWNQ